MAGGQLVRGLNFRGGIKNDLELLELLPEDEVEWREALRASIIDRVDGLVAADAKRRRLQSATSPDRRRGGHRDLCRPGNPTARDAPPQVRRRSNA